MSRQPHEKGLFHVKQRFKYTLLISIIWVTLIVLSTPMKTSTEQFVLKPVNWLYHGASQIRNGLAVLYTTFLTLKSASLYQCLEMCTKYKMCLAINFYFDGTCNLLRTDTSGPPYSLMGSSPSTLILRNDIPKEFAGKCKDIDCPYSSRCDILANGPMCIPHGVPTYDTCDGWWNLLGSKCYYFNFWEEASWENASISCQTKGAHLLEINTLDENQLTIDYAGVSNWKMSYFMLLRGYWCNPCYNATGFWIGLKYTVSGWTWSMSNTSPVVMDWIPDVNETEQVGMCMMFRRIFVPNPIYIWSAEPCDTVVTFICEKDATHFGD